MTQQTATMVPPAVRIGWSHTFLHSLAFVLGFGLIFTLLGSAAGLMGRNLNYLLPVVQKFGAVLLVFFALVVTGLVNRLATSLRARMDLEATPRPPCWCAASTWPTACSTRNAGWPRCTRCARAGAI